MASPRGLKILVGVAWFCLALVLGVVAFAVVYVMSDGDASSSLDWAAIVFAAALLIMGIVWLVVFLRRRAKAGALEKTLGEGPGGGIDTKGEVEALRKRWRESVATWKSTAAGKGGRLDDFPWFVIIGAPASGKSTLLRKSEIEFPVGDASIKGLQGTRNCDWWFSNIGIFLDTAGRYVSDESAEEWFTFLELLRRLRGEAPINGVIVTLPVPDLLTKPTDELENDARRIRARLDELIDILGVNFPVWIVLTKVDLIPGFVEFFGAADVGLRRQIMGWTVDHAEGMRFDRAQYDQRFTAMITRLREIRPSMLAKASLRERPAAFAFPDDFAAAQRPLGDSLQCIFAPNVYQETPYCRGVYVTSAIQQGTLLQRAAASIREMLGVRTTAAETHAGSSRSYFLRDLVHERIVADRSLVWTTTAEIARGRLVRLGKVLTGVAVGVFLVLAVLAYGMKSHRRLGDVRQELTAEETASGVGATNRLYDVWESRTSGAFEDLGLLQEKRLKRRLGEEARAVYIERVLAPLVALLEQRLAAAEATKGFDAVRTRWETTQRIVAALRATRIPLADGRDGLAATPSTPPGDGAGGDEDDGGDGPGAGDDGGAREIANVPPGRFLPEEVEAFAALRGELVAAGVARAPVSTESDPENAPVPEVPDLLLLQIHRFGMATQIPDDEELGASARATLEEMGERFAALDERLGALRPLLLEKAAAWARTARQQIVARDRYLEANRGREDEWVQGFVRRCTDVRAILDGDVEPEDIESAVLEPLIEAAGNFSGDGEKTYDDAILAAVRGDLDAVVKLLTDDERAAIPEIGELRGALSANGTQGTAETPETPDEGGASGATTERRAKRDALIGLQSELQSLLAASRNGDLVPTARSRRPTTLADAVDEITADVESSQRRWLERVVPHLWRLAGKPGPAEYEKDEDRWGIVVEELDRALRHDARYLAFFEHEGRGGYAYLARRLIDGRVRDAAAGKGAAPFGEVSIRDDVEDLAAPALRVLDEDLWPASAPTVRDLALASFTSDVRKLRVAAQGYWDGRCGELPAPRGDPFLVLEAWTKRTGDVSKLANEIAKTFEAAWSAPSSLNQAGAEQLARVWATEVTGLRARYSFFWDALPELQERLESLQAHRKRPLGTGALSDFEAVAADLGYEAGQPAAWHIGDIVGSDVLPAESVSGLRAAVAEGEQRIVQSLAGALARRWEGVRIRFEGSLRNGGSPDPLDEDYRRLRGLLVAVFGADLQSVRRFEDGRTLVVPADFRQLDARLRDQAGVVQRLEQGVTLRFAVSRVPAFRGAGQSRPVLKIVYRATGRNDVAQTWEPGDQKTLAIEWSPSSATSLTLLMVSDARDEDGDALRTWSGRNCVLDALSEGGARWSGSDTVTWTAASGDYDPVVCSVRYDERARDVRDAAKLLLGAATTSIPRDCAVLEGEAPK